jgi:hypothetical protein
MSWLESTPLTTLGSTLVMHYSIVLTLCVMYFAQVLQPQLVTTVGEVAELMQRMEKERIEVVQPAADAVKVDEAYAQEQAQVRALDCVL